MKRVVFLSLPYHKLSGSISPDIGKLNHLRILLIFMSQGLLLVEKFVLLLIDMETILRWDFTLSLVATITFSAC
ncbi:hypothetical protein IFM89_013008 [Coptis chinensis]|uniref:Uncharacterized protein n=1 Tax=Coptis chinensis TaxID=261450 RepID=A0A835GX52_9MAGN|nr:hypothetical protein IFM89_013008 [Coptis chinensis]